MRSPTNTRAPARVTGSWYEARPPATNGGVLTSVRRSSSRKPSAGKRRPSTSIRAPSAAAMRRATPSTRRASGGSPWVPGITSTVAR